MINAKNTLALALTLSCTCLFTEKVDASAANKIFSNKNFHEAHNQGTLTRTHGVGTTGALSGIGFTEKHFNSGIHAAPDSGHKYTASGTIIRYDNGTVVEKGHTTSKTGEVTELNETHLEPASDAKTSSLTTASHTGNTSDTTTGNSNAAAAGNGTPAT